MARVEAGSQSEFVVERLQALGDCLRAQRQAVARGDLAEAAGLAEAFDRIRASLQGIGPAADPAVQRRIFALLEELCEEHRRLVTGLQLAQREIGERLRQMQERRPVVAAYRQQVAASAAVTREGKSHAGLGFVVGH